MYYIYYIDIYHNIYTYILFLFFYIYYVLYYSNIYIYIYTYMTSNTTKQRAASLARIQHNAVPAELFVKEVMVNKGMSYKRMRIMGRGRSGIGYKRYSHVTVKVEIINFNKMIGKFLLFYFILFYMHV